MSARKLSLEDGAEENLPLYEEFQYSEGVGNVLPPVKASPLEVSDFLIHLLIDSRGMSTDEARRVAALWNKGTGQELRSFPPAMYFDIFGKEDGWIVYKEVHLAIHREKSKSIMHRHGAFILLAAVLCFEFAAVTVAVAGLKDVFAEEIGVIAVFASLFGGIGCVGAIVCAVIAADGPEKNIESELRQALNKTGPQQS